MLGNCYPCGPAESGSGVSNVSYSLHPNKPAPEPSKNAPNFQNYFWVNHPSGVFGDAFQAVENRAPTVGTAVSSEFHNVDFFNFMVLIRHSSCSIRL